jgi:ABC-type molybdenum transport system ATPase subunit/photorepair protein PhrA
LLVAHADDDIPAQVHARLLAALGQVVDEP